jgi:integrase
MKKEKFIYDKKRLVWIGQFHDLQKSGTSHPPRVTLGTSEECKYKATKRGPVRRSESELVKWLTVLYDKKRHEYETKQEAIESIARGKLADGPLIQGLMQNWIDDDVQPSSKPGTVNEYRRTCTLFLDICGNFRIRKFRKLHANKFQNGLTGRDLSDSSVRKHQTQLQVFLNWSFTEEHLDKPVRIKKIKVSYRGPEIYSEAELKILQATIETALKSNPNSYQKRCIKNHLRAFMLARHSVLRNGEILNLPLRHLLLDETLIRVSAVPEIDWSTKTRQERFVPMNPELHEFLKIDMQGRQSQEKWFLDNGKGGQAFSTNSQLTQALRRHKKRCGLDRVGLKPLQSLRSTGITSMLANGGKMDFVMKIAGHSNPQTTLNHYVRSENFDLQDTVNLLSN